MKTDITRNPYSFFYQPLSLMLFYQFNPNRLNRFLRTVFFAFLIFFSGSLLAQSRDDVTLSEAYPYISREGNRHEGIIPPDEKTVTGYVELKSLVFYEKGWRELNTTETSDSASIFFDAPISGNSMEVSVLDWDMKYFMDPDTLFSNADGLTFTWPAIIMNEVKLPQNKLKGFAMARMEGKPTYFPIYFLESHRSSEALIMEFSLIYGSVPEEPIIVDVFLCKGISPCEQDPDHEENIYAEDLLFKRISIQLGGDELVTFSLPVKLDSSKETEFRLAIVFREEEKELQGVRDKLKTAESNITQEFFFYVSK